jgi:hypothetical protein
VFGEDDMAVVRYKPKGTGYQLNSNVLVESSLPEAMLFERLERALNMEGCVEWIEEGGN